MDDLTRTDKAGQRQPLPKADGWPHGTTVEDRRCWVCAGPTSYRQCKIICQVCGFTRDCSDP